MGSMRSNENLLLLHFDKNALAENLLSHLSLKCENFLSLPREKKK